MKKKYIVTTLAVILLTSFTTYSKSTNGEIRGIADTKNSNSGPVFIAPANDEPSGATALAVGPDFDTNAVIGTNVDATASEVADPQIPAPTCGNYLGGDVWYTAVIPANGNIVFETKAAPASSIGDTAISVYSGTIGSLTHVVCHNDSDGTSFSKINLSGQTPGETLFLRVWEKSNNDFGNFKVSAWSTDAPANDEPALAQTLTVGPDFATNAVVGTNDFATSTTEYTPVCGGIAEGDVWYKVVVPVNGSVSIETQLEIGSHFTDTVLSVSSGIIGSLVEIACNDDWTGSGFSKIDLIGQTAGATLYIRVWEKGNNSFGNFQISASNPPPVNDDPSGATALTIGPDFDTNAVIGTNVDATASEVTDTQIPAPPCGNYLGGDVWYTIVVPANGNIVFETKAAPVSTIGDTAISVYSGTIGSLVHVACHNDSDGTSFSKINLSGQTPGETLFLRVWEKSNNDFGNFKVSAWSTDAPANDEPSLAPALTVGPDFATNAVIGSNDFATSTTEYTPGCGGVADGDVWYKVEVPVNGNVTIETQLEIGSHFSDTVLSVSSGTIGSLVEIACNNDWTGNGFSKIDLSGQTPGATLYIRVWENGNNSFGNFQISAWIPPPVNDDPSGAIALTVGSDFAMNALIGTNASATASEIADTQIPAPGCANYSGGDVWYTVVVPGNGILNIETQLETGSLIDDTGVGVYSGTVGTLTLIECDDLDGVNSFSLINLTGQTPGATLYIRAWENGNDASGNFQISAWNPSVSLTNDDPSGATALTIGPDFDTNAVIGTNVDATASEVADPQIPAPTCGNYLGGDVWYTIVVPANGNIVFETKAAPVSSIGDTAISVYSGTIGSLVHVACHNDSDGISFSKINLSGQTPGETLFLRVWEYGNNTFGNFKISAWSTDAPANDEPSLAPALTVGPDFATNAVIGSNDFATSTTEYTPGCGGVADGDVWYKVEVPVNGNVTIETQLEIGSHFSDTVLSVSSGTIGSLVEIACNNDWTGNGFSKIDLSGQTPGATLYIRVWENGNNSFGNFQISAWIPPPVNDDPSGAIALTVGSDFAMNALIGTNALATASEIADTQIPAPGCANYNGGDVWYTVVVPGNGILNIETQLETGSLLDDTGVGVYSGTVGTLTLIECDDLDGVNSFSLINLTGQTPGATLYIRAWENGNDAYGDFQISAWSSILPPNNDEPSGAIALTVGPDFDTNAVIGTNVNATASEVADSQIPTPPCGNYQGGDVWYTVVVPTNGNIAFETKAAPASSIGDTAISVYSGTIGSLVHVACHNDSAGISFSKINLSGQTPGETLFLRVWEKSNNDLGNFKVSAWSTDAPANDEPSLAQTLTIGPDFATNAVVGSNDFASSTVDYTPVCGGLSDGDVWYKLVVPANGIVSIETQLVSGSHFTDTVLSVSSGVIGSLVEIACNDDWIGNGFSKIDLAGQTPGTDLYIRLWENGNNSFGNFQISAYSDPSLTWVPDDNFETELIALGFDSGPLDDFVPTANINIVTVLDVSSKSIADLTGIEAFIALSSLNCNTNNLIDLDLSSNVALTDLDCSTNLLISLDISNGNNSNITQLSIDANPDLTCVQVDTQIIADDWNSAANLPATFSADVQTNFSANCGEIMVDAKAFLQGALLNSTRGIALPLMRDDLRASGLLPTTSPYGDANFVNANIFNTGGASGTGFSEDDIVDWVRLELRDDANNAIVLASQPAFLQRDGDIVGLDGLSPVVFAQNAKHYNLVIKHRNHSAIVTSARVPFPKDQQIDFRSGVATSLGTNSQVVISGIYYAMWAGDGNNDGKIKFSGADNDVNVIKDYILADPANALNFITFASTGYLDEDTNLDGIAKFSGADNDSNNIKDLILAHPGNFLNLPTYTITTQVLED